MLQTLDKKISTKSWAENSEILSVYAGMDSSNWQLCLVESIDNSDFQTTISELAQKAIVPNPFFEIPFLKASTSALKHEAIQYLCLIKIDGTQETLKFFAPVTLTKIGILRRYVLKTWITPYSPLGMPLVADDVNQETLKAFIECVQNIKHHKAKAIVFEQIAKEGAFVNKLYLSHHLSNRLLLSVGTRRAGLKPIKNLDYIKTHFSGKRKQRLRKANNELEALGTVTFNHSNGVDTIEDFLSLEGQGWKGKRKTALNNTSETINLSRNVVLNTASEKKCHIHSLKLNNQTIAALVTFETNGYFYPWKITYDENYAKYSVGNLLATHATTGFANSENFKGLDSLAAEDNHTTQRFWPDQKEFFTMTIGIGEKATNTTLSITDELNRLKRIKETLKRHIKKNSYLERLVSSLRM